MTITLNGTTGITSPEVTLDNTAADGGQVVLKSAGYSNWNIDNYSGSLRAYYNATEYMRINSSGNVGVGTSTIAPAGGKNLQIGDRSNLMQLSVNNGLYFGNNLYYDGSTWRYNQTGAGTFVGIHAGAIVFGTASSGTAGDMATTTADKMTLTSTALSLSGVGSRGASGTVVTTTNNSVAALVRSAGYIEMQTDTGAVGVTYFLSDERKKNNIAPCVKTSSDLIKDINFIQFDWKEDSGNLGHVDVGVSAQQLQSIDSRLVNELSDGSLMVNEPALVTHLAKALQEQQAIISDLKARIETLENK